MDIFRVGDESSCGAVLLSSTLIRLGSIGMARQGVSVRHLISQHGSALISEWHSTFRDYNVPAAFDGHRRKWGRRLISLRPDAGAN